MKINYRPEIDVLRALSVISVIIYHSNIKIHGLTLFSGGFLGVDIFFLISGYLITRIILNEYLLTNNFDYSGFLIRRFKRLIPAILFVSIFSSLIAWLILGFESHKDFSNSILSTFLFSSNYYFYNIGLEYNTNNSLIIPFLHTWSLSLEEQFYFIFPLMMIYLLNNWKNKILLFFSLLLIFSFFSNFFNDQEFNSLNFYSLHTRAWELLSGAILALVTHNRKIVSKTFISNLYVITGLFLIILPILLINDKLKLSFIYKVFPLIGASLIITYYNQKSKLNFIFNNKFLIFIGLISYSLYLWHYPIFAFSRISNIAGGNYFIKFFILLIVISLSIFSYRYIETPFRKKIKFKKLFFCSLLLMIVLMMFNNLIDQNKIELYQKKNLIIQGNNLDNNYLASVTWEGVNKNYKSIFSEDERKKILIVGDSHSKDTFNILTATNQFNKYEFLRFGNDKPNTWISFYCNNKLNEKCYLNKLDKFIENINFIKADAIIISDAFNDNSIYTINYLDQFIEILKKHNKEIFLFSKSIIYETSFSLNKFTELTLVDKYLLENKNKKIETNNLIKLVSIEMFKNKQLSLYEDFNINLKNLANQKKIEYFNKEEYLCDNDLKICHGMNKDGIKLFYDKYHITIEGAEFFGKKLGELNILNLK